MDHKQKFVDLFLNWPVPVSVCVDKVMTTTGMMTPQRFGTGILTADEAGELYDYIVKSLPAREVWPVPEPPRNGQLTLAQAIESGKPFRRKRPGPDRWYFLSPMGRIYVEIEGAEAALIAKTPVQLLAGDITATDWEVK